MAEVLRPPTGLGKRARDLWTSILDRYTLRPDELELLAELVTTVDEIDRLRRAVRKHGELVEGSKGQLVANPALAQITARRATVARLVAQLRIPDPDAAATRPTITSIKAARAANSRWRREQHRGA